MKYIALLRGINVGKGIRVNMKRLIVILTDLGFTEVSTYINSGNVFFESGASRKEIEILIENCFISEFGTTIPTLIKTDEEIRTIAEAIPANWMNDDKQKTDIAYLFPELDSPDIIEQMPVKKDYIDFKYVNGALIWNVLRKNAIRAT